MSREIDVQQFARRAAGAIGADHVIVFSLGAIAHFHRYFIRALAKIDQLGSIADRAAKFRQNVPHTCLRAILREAQDKPAVRPAALKR